MNETYAPVCDENTRMVIYENAAKKKLHMHKMDAKTAFLNGEPAYLTYCEPPFGLQEGREWYGN